jgi:hypothetical protein
MLHRNSVFLGGKTEKLCRKDVSCRANTIVIPEVAIPIEKMPIPA